MLWCRSQHSISPEPEQADAADLESGARVMAALRNLAIGALRLAERIDVTEATRWAGRSMDRPFTIL
jgi:hypothetical protein